MADPIAAKAEASVPLATLPPEGTNALGQPIQSMLALFEPLGWAQALATSGFSAAETASIILGIARNPDAPSKTRLDALEMIRRWSQDILLKQGVRRTVQVLQGQVGPDGQLTGVTARETRIIEEGGHLRETVAETEAGLAAAFAYHPTLGSRAPIVDVEGRTLDGDDPFEDEDNDR